MQRSVRGGGARRTMQLRPARCCAEHYEQRLLLNTTSSRRQANAARIAVAHNSSGACAIALRAGVERGGAAPRRWQLHGSRWQPLASHRTGI